MNHKSGVLGMQHKASLLRKSPYFEGWSSGAPLIQKQMIFLVLSGNKPAGNAINASDPPVDPSAIAGFLDQLGLFYVLKEHADRSVEAFVSLDPHLPSQLVAAEDSPQEFGRLIGYPDTAVTAFCANELMNFDDERRLFAKAGIPYDAMPAFRLSQKHAAEEMKVVQQWWGALCDYKLDHA